MTRYELETSIDELRYMLRELGIIDDKEYLVHGMIREEEFVGRYGEYNDE